MCGIITKYFRSSLGVEKLGVDVTEWSVVTLVSGECDTGHSGHSEGGDTRRHTHCDHIVTTWSPVPPYTSTSVITEIRNMNRIETE